MSQFWNCGYSKWMHGTEDACDLYLPERKPAPKQCPFVVFYKEHRRLEFERQLASCVTQTKYYPTEQVSQLMQTATGARMGLAAMAEHEARQRRALAGLTGQTGLTSFMQGVLGGAVASGLLGRRR